MINPTEFKTAVNRPELVQIAKTVFMAMAYAETIRPVVNAYHQKVLDEMQVKPDQEWIDRGVEQDEVITNIEHSYLMSDADSEVYFRRLDEEKEKAGFKGLQPGYCPLLVAEDIQRQAEHALIEAMAPLTGIDHNDLFRMGDGVNTYKKYLKLTLGLFAPLIK